MLLKSKQDFSYLLSSASDLQKRDNSPMPFNVDELVKLCGIDRKTAHRWATGQQPIGKIALKLLNLHAHGRVIPDSRDWQAWRFYGENLTFDRSNWRFNGQQAREMFWTVREVAPLKAEVERLKAKIAYLESVTPRAPVVATIAPSKPKRQRAN